MGFQTNIEVTLDVFQDDAVDQQPSGSGEKKQEEMKDEGEKAIEEEKIEPKEDMAELKEQNASGGKNENEMIPEKV